MGLEASKLFVEIGKIPQAVRTATVATAENVIRNINALLQKIPEVYAGRPLAIRKDTEMLQRKREELEQILAGQKTQQEEVKTWSPEFLRLSSIATSSSYNYASLGQGTHVQNTKDFGAIITNMSDEHIDALPLIQQGKDALKDLRKSFLEMTDNSKEAWLKQGTFVGYQWKLVISREEGKETFVARDDLGHISNRKVRIVK